MESSSRPNDAKKQKPLTLRQAEGYLHAPNVSIQRLALTAVQAIEQRDEAQRLLRDAQERLAGVELEKQPILILADHRGGIVVRAKDHQPVRIIPVHESEDRNPDTEDDDARNRTPLSHKDLWDCKPIATGHTGLDRYRRFWGEVQLAMVKTVTPPPPSSGN
jgi:hypothetical protein